MSRVLGARALIALATMLFIGACTSSESNLRSRVVVKVNDAVLTAGDFSDQLAARLRGFNSLMARDTNIISQIKNSIVQDFVIQVVTESWAKKNQIFVRKEQLDAEITKVRSSYADDIAFRKTLAAEGLTYEDWVKKMTQTLLARLVAESLRKEIAAPSKEEAEAIFNSDKAKFQVSPAVRVRQIVLENQHEAEMVNKKIRAGRSLADLAKEYSIAPEGKDGGNIGWVEKGALPVFDSAFRLNVGQKSSVLQSPFGYHILEVLEKRAGRALKFEEARPRIEQIVLEKKEQEHYSRWLEEQLLTARVFKDEALLNSIQIFSRGD